MRVDGSTPTRRRHVSRVVACLAGPSRARQGLGQLGHGREDRDAADVTTFEIRGEPLELVERGVGQAVAEQRQGAGVARRQPADLDVGGGGETEGLGDVLLASGAITAYGGDERKRAVRLRHRERAEHERSEVDRLGPRGVRGVEVALRQSKQVAGPCSQATSAMDPASRAAAIAQR